MPSSPNSYLKESSKVLICIIAAAGVDTKALCSAWLQHVHAYIYIYILPYYAAACVLPQRQSPRTVNE